MTRVCRSPSGIDTDASWTIDASPITLPVPRLGTSVRRHLVPPSISFWKSMVTPPK